MPDLKLYSEFRKSQKRYYKISLHEKPVLETTLVDQHIGNFKLTNPVLAAMVGHMRYRSGIAVLDYNLEARMLETEDVNIQALNAAVASRLTKGVVVKPCPCSYDFGRGEYLEWRLVKIGNNWKVSCKGITCDPFEIQRSMIECGDQTEVAWPLFNVYKGPASNYLEKIAELLDSLNSFTYSRLRYMMRHYVVYESFQIVNPKFTADRDAFLAFQQIYMLLGGILQFINWYVSTPSAVLWWEVLELFVNRKPVFNRTWPIKEKRTLYQLKDYQRQLIDQLHTDTLPISFIWLDTGLGKTKIILNYLREINDEEEMPKYVIWVSAKSSLVNIQSQSYQDGFKAKVVKSTTEIQEGHINIISHTRFIKFDTDSLVAILRRSVFVLDECQLAFSDSMYGNSCHNAVELAAKAINVTGTLYRSETALKYLGRFMAINYNFKITDDNFLVVVNDIISKKVEVPITSHYEDIVTPSPIISLVDKIRQLNSQDLAVFVAVTSAKEQTKVVNLLEKYGISYEVFDSRQDYGPDYYPSERGPAYIEDGMSPVVITTLANVEGYNMNRYAHLVIHAEMTNEAVRKQLEGRIRRADNTANDIYYHYFYASDKDKARAINDRQVSKLVESARRD